MMRGCRLSFELVKVLELWELPFGIGERERGRMGEKKVDYTEIESERRKGFS